MPTLSINRETGRRGWTMSIACVSRQPIYGSQVNVFAYELLFRDMDREYALFADGDQATASVLLNTFLEIGLDRVVGPHLAFVNMTRGFLLGEHCESLPKDRVVLEVLEDIEPDPQLACALARLQRAGYQIALDDFVYTDQWAPLIGFSNIVKLDVMAQDRKTVERQVATLKHFPVKLLAEKVETHEDFEFCKNVGFDYFQGYFFCKPKLVSTQQIPFNRLATLRLLAKLQNTEIPLRELEETVGQDLALSYKLLRYVNSAFSGLSRKVESIRHAVNMVGTNRLRTWASLVMFARMEDKPRELMIIAATRARMCELLAKAVHGNDPDKYFTVGLFSVLDALLDTSLPQALDLLSLADDIQNALLKHEGPMGQILRCVLAYEKGFWEEAEIRGLDHESLRDAYLDSVDWTRSLMSGLSI